jgi:hypothetical protein
MGAGHSIIRASAAPPIPEIAAVQTNGASGSFSLRLANETG